MKFQDFFKDGTGAPSIGRLMAFLCVLFTPAIIVCYLLFLRNDTSPIQFADVALCGITMIGALALYCFIKLYEARGEFYAVLEKNPETLAKISEKLKIKA